MKKPGYTANIPLDHNEVAAKINVETGEVTQINVKVSKITPKSLTQRVYTTDEPWGRTLNGPWRLLRTQLNNIEWAVANTIALYAEAYTNSLQPLGPESTIKELSETLYIGKNIVTKIVDKLFKLGVIGKFEVYDRFEEHQNYWIFNPYLTYNGKTIKHDLENLFRNTHYAKMSSKE